jgi:hypothetical protein
MSSNKRCPFARQLLGPNRPLGAQGPIRPRHRRPGAAPQSHHRDARLEDSRCRPHPTLQARSAPPLPKCSQPKCRFSTQLIPTMSRQFWRCFAGTIPEPDPLVPHRGGPCPPAGLVCTRPSSYSISSRGTPFVSGITLSTQMSWPTMQIAKMLNPTPPPRAPTMGGKA